MYTNCLILFTKLLNIIYDSLYMILTCPQCHSFTNVSKLAN